MWHWLTFLFFTASITTVIFASTLFKSRINIAMVQEQVQQKGGLVTKEQAMAVAHEYNDKLWMLHKFVGYGLCILLLFRIVTEVVLSKEKRLGYRIKQAMNFPASGEQKHYLFAEFGYLIFYILFFTMAFTGLILAFEDVKWLNPFYKTAKNIHAFVQYALYTYAVLHIAGVIRADMTKYGGIVSRMINGGEQV